MRSLLLLRATAPIAVLALLALLAGCTPEDEPESEPQATTPTPQPSATAAPTPDEGACYRLSFDAALAYTSDAAPRRCRGEHTSVTYAVGALNTVVDGHLVAVDSRRVKEQVAETCPRLLAGYVGGSVDQRRLSMLRAVWFTPTVEESDGGAA